MSFCLQACADICSRPYRSSCQYHLETQSLLRMSRRGRERAGSVDSSNPLCFCRSWRHEISQPCIDVRQLVLRAHRWWSVIRHHLRLPRSWGSPLPSLDLRRRSGLFPHSATVRRRTNNKGTERWVHALRAYMRDHRITAAHANGPPESRHPPLHSSTP